MPFLFKCFPHRLAVDRMSSFSFCSFIFFFRSFVRSFVRPLTLPFSLSLFPSLIHSFYPSIIFSHFLSLSLCLSFPLAIVRLNCGLEFNRRLKFNLVNTSLIRNIEDNFCPLSLSLSHTSILHSPSLPLPSQASIVYGNFHNYDPSRRAYLKATFPCIYIYIYIRWFKSVKRGLVSKFFFFINNRSLSSFDRL